MSFFIYLNSKDSSHPAANYDLYFPLNYPTLQNVSKFLITLQNIEFTNAVYPINEFNNTLIFNENIFGTKTATIPAGNYTGSTLATQLGTSMTTSSGTSTYTATYDSTDKTFSITSSTVLWKVVNSTSTLLWNNLGYISSTSYALTQSGTYPIMISGTNYVDIITSINTNSISSKTTASILCRVPVSVSFSEIVYYEPTAPNTIALELPTLRELYFRLLDDGGNYYKLPANNHISMTLKITPL